MNVDQLVKAELPNLQGWCTLDKAIALVRFIQQRKPLLVVELGVFGGSSFIPIALALKSNHSGFAWGIDPYSREEDVSAYAGRTADDIANVTYWAKVDYETIYMGAVGALRRNQVEANAQIIRTTSQLASPHFNNIGLLHVDSNHSERSSVMDVSLWLPRVKQGGVVVFDDIDWPTTKRAVDIIESQCEKVLITKNANGVDSCAFFIKR